MRAGWRAGRETLETLGRSCETQRPPFEVRNGAIKSARVREGSGARQGEMASSGLGQRGQRGDWRWMEGRQGRAGQGRHTNGEGGSKEERGGRPQLGFGAPSSSLPSIFSSPPLPHVSLP